MKRPSISLATTRAKIITALLVTLTIVTISGGAAYYQTPSVHSQASATGSLNIIWGESYLTPTVSEGTGSESVSVTGNAAPQPNTPGYYAYSTMTASGTVHAEWSDKGNSYVLDASLFLDQDETGYEYGHESEKVTLNPSGNSFYVALMDFDASLTVNGATHQSSGYAGVKAAAPGFFTQKGQARIITIILYAQSLGNPQYVIRWSEASQIVDGIQLPAAFQFSQWVTVTG